MFKNNIILKKKIYINNNINNNIKNHIKNHIKNVKMDQNVQKVALFCNARDEKHIREWVAHHLLIGFDNIIIFDHNSITPISRYFGNFDKRLTIIKHSTKPSHSNVKRPLMNKALDISRKINCDWFIYLDADEFIILNDELRGIKDLLNRYKFADSLALNWLMFGTNYLKNDPDSLILENYTKSNIILSRLVKSFVRPFQAISATNPHFYNIKNKTKMYALNTVLNDKKEPFYSNINNVEHTKVMAYIAHHVYQSEETYIKRKINLKRDDCDEYRDKNNNIHSEYNIIENIFPKTKYAENIKKFLKQYGHEF